LCSGDPSAAPFDTPLHVGRLSDDTTLATRPMLFLLDIGLIPLSCNRPSRMGGLLRGSLKWLDMPGTSSSLGKRTILAILGLSSGMFLVSLMFSVSGMVPTLGTMGALAMFAMSGMMGVLALVGVMVVLVISVISAMIGMLSPLARLGILAMFSFLGMMGLLATLAFIVFLPMALL
jgi:hypothetical protein